MDYNKSLQFLRELTKFGFNFGLARIQKLLELLGNPEKVFETIHVAGTNGKGSVCAYTSNILTAAGYKTGLFTSPHLHSYTERIKINGVDIPREAVARYIEQFKPLILQMVDEGYEHPTEFEVNTALAFKYFADEKVNIAVIEVGLGGAIDSTNVINPVVTAITNVSLDHTDYLGNSVEEIASVKAGIIKKGVPCITATKGSALQVISARCDNIQAPLIVIDQDINLIYFKEYITETEMTFKYGEKVLPTVKISLLGEHQKFNVGVAVGIVQALREKGFSISDEALLKGFNNTKWPARLEVLSREPLILLDAAHNAAGAQVLAKALEKILSQKAVFVLGILADKERKRIISELMPYAEHVIVTKPNTPRAGNWLEVYEVINGQKISSEVEENIIKAVEKARKYLRPVVITGSIYMVAEARAHLLGITQE